MPSIFQGNGIDENTVTYICILHICIYAIFSYFNGNGIDENIVLLVYVVYIYIYIYMPYFPNIDPFICIYIMYIYVYVYTYTYMHIHIHAYIFIYMCMHIYIHDHVYITHLRRHLLKRERKHMFQMAYIGERAFSMCTCTRIFVYLSVYIRQIVLERERE